jgi:hypothetical protein
MAASGEELADAELDRAIEVLSRRSSSTAEVTGCATTRTDGRRPAVVSRHRVRALRARARPVLAAG